jgi:hypothetical protein
MATLPPPAYQLVGLDAEQIRVTHVALRLYAKGLRRRIALAKVRGCAEAVARLTDRLSEVLMTRSMIRVTSKILAARPDASHGRSLAPLRHDELPVDEQPLPPDPSAVDLQ